MPGRGPGLSLLVGLHRAPAGRARRPRRADRRRAARGGAGRRGGPPRRRPPDRRLHPRWSRATPGAGSRRRRGPTTSPTSPSGRPSTGSTSPPPARPTSRRCDASIYPLARRLATRLTKEHHAQAARTAGLPAYRPCLDLHRRGPADHPPPAPAPAPHRAGRALRRERLGGELRAVHAAAGVRAARPVPEGAGVHLRRPRPRGDPALPARRRRRRRDGRPRGEHGARRPLGPHQLRPGLREVRRGGGRRAGPQDVAADPRRRAIQLQRPERPGARATWPGGAGTRSG